MQSSGENPVPAAWRQAGDVTRAVLMGLAVFSVLGPASADAQSRPAVPVHVGGEFDLPACQARAALLPATPGAERVDIGSGPTGSFRPIDRLPVGTQVFVCDENGNFRGIIYGEGDCGLLEPITRRAPYRGSCSAGWIHSRQLEPSDAGAV